MVRGKEEARGGKSQVIHVLTRPGSPSGMLRDRRRAEQLSFDRTILLLFLIMVSVGVLPCNVEELIDEGVLTLENAPTIAAELAGDEKVETVPADSLAGGSDLVMNRLDDGGYYNARHRVRISDWPEGWVFGQYREWNSEAISVLEDGPC